MSNNRSGDAATLVAYPFGALWGWFIATTGEPLWVAILVSIVAALLNNVISNAIASRQKRND